MKKTRKTLIRLQRDNPWSTEKIRDKQGNSRATRESAVLQAQYTAAHPWTLVLTYLSFPLLYYCSASSDNVDQHGVSFFMKNSVILTAFLKIKMPFF